MPRKICVFRIEPDAIEFIVDRDWKEKIYYRSKFGNGSMRGRGWRCGGTCAGISPARGEECVKSVSKLRKMNLLRIGTDGN
jgi:hypothetical protein